MSTLTVALCNFEYIKPRAVHAKNWVGLGVKFYPNPNVCFSSREAFLKVCLPIACISTREDTMKRLFLTFEIALISVLAVMSTVATGLACRPIHQPFSAGIQVVSTVCDGRSWRDDKGMIHIRGMVVDGVITGDINGQIRITQNLNLDAAFAGGHSR